MQLGRLPPHGVTISVDFDERVVPMGYGDIEAGRVQSTVGPPGILAVRAVEARGDKGQVKRAIVPLAVHKQGRRHVVWERQPEKLWRAQPSAQNGSHADKNLALPRQCLEPMLQREFEYLGLAKGSRAFEAKLIGWVGAS